jgi:arginase
VAAKIVRQFNKIVLLGAPTSAAALSAGHEKAPAALRAAGLAEKLRSVGYEVVDLGDDGAQTFQPDEESPRARNVKRVLASLEALKPRVEQAVKTAALPVILTGDCSTVLATVAGARRYFRNVNVVYMDRDADLNIPATTPSGCVDGMVISHLTGRGAPELVRFWGEPQLVREPDVTLFGVDRFDPPEEKALESSTLRRYLSKDVKRLGAKAAAEKALERIKTNGYEFVLHLDVDVISDFSATNFPGSGGLTLDDVREAMLVFAQQPRMAALEIAAYNPEKDPDGSAAKQLIDLVTEVLAARYETLKAIAAAAPPPPVKAPKAEAAPAPAAAPATAPAEAPSSAGAPENFTFDPVPGEPWSSDSLTDSDTDAETGEHTGERAERDADSVEDAGDSESGEPTR